MNDSRTTDPPPRDNAGNMSYRVSSFELRAGLDLSLLPLSLLPADMLRELQRLRRCWQHGSAPPPSPA